jgi:hypothetical protein
MDILRKFADPLMPKPNPVTAQKTPLLAHLQPRLREKFAYIYIYIYIIH